MYDNNDQKSIEALYESSCECIDSLLHTYDMIKQNCIDDNADVESAILSIYLADRYMKRWAKTNCNL